jgi:multimeric flavodoxin WrbA
MVEADGIILASPVYVGSATPQIKALIDRAAYLSGARGRVFENKVGGVMVVARWTGLNVKYFLGKWSVKEPWQTRGISEA